MYLNTLHLLFDLSDSRFDDIFCIKLEIFQFNFQTNLKFLITFLISFYN